MISYSIPLCTILTKWPARTSRNAGSPAPRRQLPSTSRCTRDVADTWGDGLQNRVDDLDRFLITAHHQAVPALQTEDATAGTDVDVMQALLPKLGCAAYIVAVVGVAAIDDDVALVEQTGGLIDGLHVIPAGIITHTARGRSFQRPTPPACSRRLRPHPRAA